MAMAAQDSKPATGQSGCWQVEPYPLPPAEPYDINFHIRSGIQDIPSDQVELKGEIERALVTLRVLLPLSDPIAKGKFSEYFAKLLSLSQVGLSLDVVYPSVSIAALRELKAEILDREAGQVKNRYMIRLGVRAFIFSVASVVIWALIMEAIDRSIISDATWWGRVAAKYRNFFAMWAAGMVGCWLSFGIRKVSMAFSDLANLEEDRVSPSIRLIFVGIMTVAVGLILSLEVVVIQIAGFDTKSILQSGATAALVGLLCGIGEMTLPSILGQRSVGFLKAVGDGGRS
jgi:hypothetical protein